MSKDASNTESHIKVNVQDCHNHHGGAFAVPLFFVGLGLFIIALFISTGSLQHNLFALTLVLSVCHIIIEGFSDTITLSIRRKRFFLNVYIFMSLAAVGAMFIGEYLEAALLILLFAGAHYLEEYDENRSKKEIADLLYLNPTQARRIKENGEIE